MTRVKICGLTNLADAQCAQEAGADALGFVFARSPRQVSAAQVKEIISRLPQDLVTVGLFVNSPLEVVLEVAKEAGVKALQLHGEEPPEFIDKLAAIWPQEGTFGWPLLIKAFRPRSEKELEKLKDYAAVSAFLIDSYVEGIAGGSGLCADWSLALAAQNYARPIILAGGLRLDNVEQAIAQVRPFGVDVCSGVEASPGKKDSAKVKEFIRRVKQNE